MIGAIWAQTKDRVIGSGGRIPWRYPGDFRRFKRVTMGAAVVMGRLTWESIGRPLPGRTNIVLASRVMPPPDLMEVPADTQWVCMDFSGSIESSISLARAFGRADVWFIGGAQVYAEALHFLDLIDVTYVPDVVPVDGAVLAPEIDEAEFEAGELLVHEDEPALRRRVFTRRTR